jgi:hypothetical protein
MGKPTTTEPAPTPVPGIRSTLAALTISDMHYDAAQRCGHSPEQLLHQIGGSLQDACASLRQLASTAPPAEASKIAELIGRLA